MVGRILLVVQSLGLAYLFQLDGLLVDKKMKKLFSMPNKPIIWAFPSAYNLQMSCRASWCNTRIACVYKSKYVRALACALLQVREGCWEEEEEDG